MQFFLSQKDRLTLGSNGAYPNTLIEIDREGSQKNMTYMRKLHAHGLDIIFILNSLENPVQVI